MDEELDDALSTAAASSGRSRSEVMREAVRAYLGDAGARRAADPLEALIGAVDIDPVDDVDAVVYDL